MSWSNALVQYAKADPTTLPANIYVYHDTHTLTIFDLFSKAHMHWLILPRLPFKLSPDESSTNKEVEIPAHLLDSLQALSKSKHCLEVLRILDTSASKVKEMMQVEMLASKRFEWDINVGFHAAESMKHVHLHVISSDLVSDKLKNKKHYNSFRPDLGFFLHLSDVITWKEAGTLQSRIPPPQEAEKLLKEDLVSVHTNQTFPNMPKLKAHLLAEFEKKCSAAQQARKRKTEPQEGDDAPKKIKDQ